VKWRDRLELCAELFFLPLDNWILAPRIKRGYCSRLTQPMLFLVCLTLRPRPESQAVWRRFHLYSYYSMSLAVAWVERAPLRDRGFILPACGRLRAPAAMDFTHLLARHPYPCPTQMSISSRSSAGAYIAVRTASSTCSCHSTGATRGMFIRVWWSRLKVVTYTYTTMRGGTRVRSVSSSAYRRTAEM